MNSTPTTPPIAPRPVILQHMAAEYDNGAAEKLTPVDHNNSLYVMIRGGSSDTRKELARQIVAMQQDEIKNDQCISTGERSMAEAISLLGKLGFRCNCMNHRPVVAYASDCHECILQVTDYLIAALAAGESRKAGS